METKRSYLRPDQRRASILEAASEVVDQRGLRSLSLSEVARHLGVSRQLLYQHFGGLDELVTELLTMRFSVMSDSFDEAQRRVGDDPVALGTAQLRTLLGLEPRDQRLLRSVLLIDDSVAEELRVVLRQLRDEFLQRWITLAGVPEAARPYATAKIWAVVHATLGLWDGVHDGLLNESQALALQRSLARAMVDAQP